MRGHACCFSVTALAGVSCGARGGGCSTAGAMVGSSSGVGEVFSVGATAGVDILFSAH